jgi:hypothetical protein
VKRELEDQLGGWRDTQLAIRQRRQDVQMLLEGLQDLVGIQFEVAHHLRERVPLHLREREEDVFVGQEGMVPPTRFLDRPVHDPLRRLTDLALCDVEVVHGTDPPDPGASSSSHGGFTGKSRSTCQNAKRRALVGSRDVGPPPRC